jgi:hypothetical protein
MSIVVIIIVSMAMKKLIVLINAGDAWRYQLKKRKITGHMPYCCSVAEFLALEREMEAGALPLTGGL